uniref:Arginine/serine-rich coiled-coil protein 2 n=1 Tax=Hydra vulgaris TaxID=6087 RepID=T2MAA2_HYDVU
MPNKEDEPIKKRHFKEAAIEEDSESESESDSSESPCPSPPLLLSQVIPKNGVVDENIPTSDFKKKYNRDTSLEQDDKKKTGPVWDRKDKNRSLSPERNKRRNSSPSPRRKNLSPSPRRKNLSPSPRRKNSSPSPRRKNLSPSPRFKNSSSSPRRKNSSLSPRRKNSSPSPRRKNLSPSPRRKNSSPSPRRRNSSLSPRRKRSRTPPRKRHSRSRSFERKKKSRSRSPDRKRRRSRSVERKKRSRSRSRDSRRSRSPERRRGSPRRRRSFSRSVSPPRRYCSKWAKPSTGLTRAVLPANPSNKKSKEVSTEEVEQRLAEHLIAVKEKNAEEAKRINLPGYLNPAMINVQQFKQVQDKRKLLWSKAKDKKEGASQWVGAFEDQGNDEKFKRLMGIQGIQVDAAKSSKIQESKKVLDNLEKEYEKSRAFQLSRGAGGITGIGLGFGSLAHSP